MLLIVHMIQNKRLRKHDVSNMTVSRLLKSKILNIFLTDFSLNVFHE